MMVYVVNELLPGGWLEFLTKVSGGRLAVYSMTWLISVTPGFLVNCMGRADFVKCAW